MTNCRSSDGRSAAALAADAGRLTRDGVIRNDACTFTGLRPGELSCARDDASDESACSSGLYAAGGVLLYSFLQTSGTSSFATNAGCCAVCPAKDSCEQTRFVPFSSWLNGLTAMKTKIFSATGDEEQASLAENCESTNMKAR